MVNSAYEYPNEGYDASDQFNYETWTPSTRVRLCNVPWDSTYNIIVKYPNEGALNDYISKGRKEVVEVNNVSYLRVNNAVRLDIPFNRAFEYNYMHVYNPGQNQTGEGPRSYYYFIHDVRHIAPNTTEFVIQLDVWQSFCNYVQFDTGYLERGHVGIAHGQATGGSAIWDDSSILTVPEGLDLGNEYLNYAAYEHQLAATDNGISPNPKQSAKNTPMAIVVASTVRLGGLWGTIDKPTFMTAEGTTAGGLPNGCEVYAFDSVATFKTFMEKVSPYPWISKGIISVQGVPASALSGYMSTTWTQLGVTFKRLNNANTKSAQSIRLADNFRDPILSQIPERYRMLKKFKVFPYSAVELTTYSGTPLVLKPECVKSNNLEVTQLAHVIPPTPRVMFYPNHYGKTINMSGVTQSKGDDMGQSADFMTGITDFPSFSIVNDSYLQYMASTANGRAYEFSAADWSQTKALRGNQVSYDQSSRGIQQMSAMNSINNDSLAFNTANSGITNTINGAARGGAVGLAGSLVGTASSIASMGANMHFNNKRTGENMSSAAYMRDTNKDLADYSAKGDNAQAIAAINAKVQDAHLISPTTSGQVGGDAFQLATMGWKLVAKLKGLSESAVQVVGDYWLRYGYAIQRWVEVPSTLQCMTEFTYWKFTEVQVKAGKCPEQYRQTIKGIFEKGVTVFRDPEMIGKMEAWDKNQPIYGFYIRGAAY